MTLQRRRQRRGRRRRRSLTTPQRTPHPSTNPPYLQHKPPYQKRRTKRSKNTKDAYNFVPNNFLPNTIDCNKSKLYIVKKSVCLNCGSKLIVITFNNAYSLYCKCTLVVSVGIRPCTTAVWITLFGPPSWLSAYWPFWWKCFHKYFGWQSNHYWTSASLFSGGGEESCQGAAGAHDDASCRERRHQCGGCRTIRASCALR